MRRKNSTNNKQRREDLLSPKGVAFLWDESFLWGIMSYHALKKASLPFELIRSDAIRRGHLRNHAVLFVPGGWSSNKLKSLGDKGVSEIKRFVRYGGNYLGFCGGAGLATREGLGLLNIRRKPTKERVPSFSGRIRLHTVKHPVWEGINDPVFSAWWPPQFDGCSDSAHVLALYQKAMPASFSSDLNVGDVETGAGWSTFEDAYRINLNPARLYNEPAIIEGNYGMGKVLLSLVHFDTPDDPNAQTVLENLWNYLSHAGAQSSTTISNHDNKEGKNVVVDRHVPPLLNELDAAVADLIDFGIRNFLWFWRNPLLLQWRRGVRGLEYNTLYIMIRTITNMFRCREMQDDGKQLREVKKRLLPFITKSKQLLIRERFAIQHGYITFEQCHDPEIQQIRSELFSASKSYGGLFKEIIDEIDNLLYIVLRDG